MTPEQYTPTAEEVREEFIFGHQEVDMGGYVVVSLDEAKVRWDRWLAAVKAEAWDQGYAAGYANGFGDGTQPDQRANPYRKDENDE